MSQAGSDPRGQGQIGEQDVQEAGELGLWEPGVMGNPVILAEQPWHGTLQQRN